jgi:hypothetical protein
VHAEPQRPPTTTSSWGSEPFGRSLAVKIVDVCASRHVCEVAGHVVPSPFARCASRQTVARGELRVCDPAHGRDVVARRDGGSVSGISGIPRPVQGGTIARGPERNG